MTEEDGFDHLLSSIGFGRWQLIAVTATVCVVTVLPVQLTGSPLLSGPMAFRCSYDVPDSYPNSIEINESDSNSETNSSSYYTSACLPLNHSTTTGSSPSSHPNLTHHRTGLPSCPFIEYDRSTFTSTVISEHHLVCERAALQPFFQIMHSVGGMLGSTIGGQIGDKWGRIRAVQCGCIINIMAVLGITLVPIYSFMLVMRIFAGFTTQCMLVPAWNLVLEATPTRHRSLVGMFMGLPYSVCVIAFAGVAYFFRTWRQLLLVCSSPIIILLPLSFFVDESPRWLLVEGRAQETKKILQKAIKLNNAKHPDDLDSILEKIIEANRSAHPEMPDQDGSCLSKIKNYLHQVWEYLRSPGMRIILIATPILWFLQSGLYLGIVINANNFTSSDPFLYIGLTGIMDGAAILVFTPITNYFGRRIIVGLSLFIGGVLLLVDLSIPMDYYWLKWVLVMSGFFLVAGAFQVNFLYAPELFPTEARTRGFALVNMVGNIGFICAPLVTDILARYNWWAASVTFGCSGIVASLMVLFLPETRNIPLPDTIQDVEHRRTAAKIKSRKTGVENKGYEQGESVL